MPYQNMFIILFKHIPLQQINTTQSFLADFLIIKNQTF